MEETMGKRIASLRKGLSLTQEALAEKLGVTAQAVSKWENDQSCPDITMLPKLADIFGCSTDALLGREAPAVAATVEPVEEENEPEGIHFENGHWNVQLDIGRRGGIGLAAWLLMAGFLMFIVPGAALWSVLWTSGLFLFGVWGIVYPRFSLFRLCCAFWGGYFMVTEVFQYPLKDDFILSAFLICCGVCLLVKALGKPKNSGWHFSRKGSTPARRECAVENERFRCSTSFGDNRYPIVLPRLAGGSAELSFGEMEVDLSGCGEIAKDCRVELNCSFGELKLLVPKRWQVVHDVSSAFGNFAVEGAPETGCSQKIYLTGSANFGEIMVKYI